MIPNNNFFGKIQGKTIRDFTADLDYALETPEERVEFLRSKLEVENILFAKQLRKELRN